MKTEWDQQSLFFHQKGWNNFVSKDGGTITGYWDNYINKEVLVFFCFCLFSFVIVWSIVMKVNDCKNLCRSNQTKQDL